MVYLVNSHFKWNCIVFSNPTTILLQPMQRSIHSNNIPRICRVCCHTSKLCLSPVSFLFSLGANGISDFIVQVFRFSLGSNKFNSDPCRRNEKESFLSSGTHNFTRKEISAVFFSPVNLKSRYLPSTLWTTSANEMCTVSM